MITGEEAKRLICKLREVINDVNGFQDEINDINERLDEIDDILSGLGSNYELLSATFSSTGLLVSFTLNHTLGVTPSHVMLTNISPDAQDWSYITKTSTTITVHYTVAPPVGTNNLTFNAVVYR